jgi:hypothetical protein
LTYRYKRLLIFELRPLHFSPHGTKKPHLKLSIKAIPKPKNNVFQPPIAISYVVENQTETVPNETVVYDKKHFSKPDVYIFDHLKEGRVN